MRGPRLLRRYGLAQPRGYMPAGSGTFVLTGQDATLTYVQHHFTLAAASGSFTLTGQDATLTSDALPSNALLWEDNTGVKWEDGNFIQWENGVYSLAADAGSFTLTGQAATLTYTPASGGTFSSESGDNIVVGVSSWASTTALGSSVTVGSITGWFRVNASKLYYASSGGTTGSTAPTHTSGTASDGSITWEYCCAVGYTSIASWVTALAGTLSAPTVGIIWSDAEISLGSSVDFTGITTSGTNTLTLKAKEELAFYSAASPTLRYNTGKGVAIKRTSGYGPPLKGNLDNWILKGLQLKNDGGERALDHYSNGSSNVIERCIMEVTGSKVATVRGTSRNCVFIKDGTDTGTEAVELRGTPILANCTVVRPSNRTAGGSALNAPYNAGKVVNCILSGFTSAPGGSYASCSNNAGSSSTPLPSGSGNVTTLVDTAEFVQSSSGSSAHDFRIVTGAVSKNAGTTDSTDVPDSKDIFKTSRPQGAAWDIGAHEF